MKAFICAMKGEVTPKECWLCYIKTKLFPSRFLCKGKNVKAVNQ